MPSVPPQNLVKDGEFEKAIAYAQIYHYQCVKTWLETTAVPRTHLYADQRGGHQWQPGHVVGDLWAEDPRIEERNAWDHQEDLGRTQKESARVVSKEQSHSYQHARHHHPRHVTGLISLSATNFWSAAVLGSIR
jgi:hypothetical protein